MTFVQNVESSVNGSVHTPWRKRVNTHKYDIRYSCSTSRPSRGGHECPPRNSPAFLGGAMFLYTPAGLFSLPSGRLFPLRSGRPFPLRCGLCTGECVSSTGVLAFSFTLRPFPLRSGPFLYAFPLRSPEIREIIDSAVNATLKMQ